MTLDQRGDEEVTGDDEEGIDPQKALGTPRLAKMVEEDEENG